MKSMTMLAAGAFVLLAAKAVAGDEPRPENFAGDYRMAGRGFGPRDSAYSGTCTVRPAAPGYEVSCFNVDTRHTYVGKGLSRGDTLTLFIGDTLRGDHNTIFTGEYLVLYQRRADGVLEGTWLHAGSAAAGSETLTPIR
ncbi:MAG TPA: hypothetical protein VE527_25910 [Reyranella sp.]|jgi:hypothetical protein|nr:hypothetical protein [Reyranella sp.]